jgi:uncharacterized protein YndB with AHSA1/START domain
MLAVVHNTFVVERDYPKPPAHVFAAFTDPARKKRWYAVDAAHEVVSYEADIRLGGREKLVGRMKPGTPIAGALLTWASTYEDMIDGARIVFTQTLDRDDSRISCALITAEFTAAGEGCHLKLTHQAVYFEGADGPQMREHGWRFLADAVARALD